MKIRNEYKSTFAQYILGVFPICTNIYLGPSPSIVSVKELLPMTENPILIETSFAEAVVIIAAAQELPEQTRRHWPSSMRQIAKAWISQWR